MIIDSLSSPAGRSHRDPRLLPDPLQREREQLIRHPDPSPAWDAPPHRDDLRDSGGVDPCEHLACLSQTSLTPCGTSSTDGANAYRIRSPWVLAAPARSSQPPGGAPPGSALMQRFSQPHSSANKVVVSRRHRIHPQFAEWNSFQIWLSCG